MKSKDKQIRELKKDRDFYKTYFDDWGYWFLGCILFLVIIIVVVSVLVPKISELEQQLESCQDKVPVWDKKDVKEDTDLFHKYYCRWFYDYPNETSKVIWQCEAIK